MDKIDTWIEDRFGTKNTFNRQLLDNFIEFLEKELGFAWKTDEEDELKVVGMIRRREREGIIKQIEPIMSALLYIHELPHELKVTAYNEWQALKEEV